MRRPAAFRALLASLVALACTDQTEQQPTAPSDRASSPSLSTTAAACIGRPQLDALILEVFKTDTSAARAEASLDLIDVHKVTRDTAAAQDEAWKLVDYTLDKYAAGELRPELQSDPDPLVNFVNGVFCYVGISASMERANAENDGAAAVVGREGGTVVTPSKNAGTRIPRDALDERTLITIEKLDDDSDPLFTDLDQYPLFYHIAGSPVDSFKQDVEVATCQAGSLPPDVVMAHNVSDVDPTQGIELLPKVTVTFLDCSEFAGQSQSRLRSVFRGLASALLPRRLHAATLASVAVEGCCLGGTSKNYSPFGWVDPNSQVSANSPTSQSGTATHPVASPPSVRIASPNGDTPMPNIPVTFTVTSGGGTLTGASQLTDANGVATAGGWTLGPQVGPQTVTATATVPQPMPGVKDPGNALKIVGSPVTFTANAVAPNAQVVNSCSPSSGAGDPVSKAFYLPSYPGSSLSAVELYLSSNAPANTPVETYTFRLVVGEGSFSGGPTYTSKNVNVDLTGSASENKPAQFTFPQGVLTGLGGKLLTFRIEVVNNPVPGASLLFNTGKCGLGDKKCKTACPAIETESATDPFVFRRQGVGVKLIGQ